MKSPHRTCSGFPAWLLAASLLAGGAAAHAQGDVKAILLVATPTLQGAYSQTTLVVVPVAGKHLGFILNRATDLKLSAVFPGHATAAGIVDPVYVGGPEMDGSLFAMVRSDPGGQSLNLFGTLFVTGGIETITRILDQSPHDVRFFAGFVGWQPGELEKEIRQGLWYVDEPDAALVFRADTTGMWEELVKRLDHQRPARMRGQLDTRLSR